MKHKKILRYVTLSLLLAIAIVLNYLESFIPPVGIPGVKLGLANIVILICLYKYKTYEALIVDLLRVVLANLLKGTFLSIAFYMSLSGAMLSFLIMFLFRYIKRLKPLVISVIGAVFHAVGQIVVALIIMQTSGILLYLPFIMLASIITGVLNGIVCERIIATNLFENLEKNSQDE